MCKLKTLQLVHLRVCIAALLWKFTGQAEVSHACKRRLHCPVLKDCYLNSHWTSQALKSPPQQVAPTLTTITEGIIRAPQSKLSVAGSEELRQRFHLICFRITDLQLTTKVAHHRCVNRSQLLDRCKLHVNEQMLRCRLTRAYTSCHS